MPQNLHREFLDLNSCRGKDRHPPHNNRLTTLTAISLSSNRFCSLRACRHLMKVTVNLVMKVNSLAAKVLSRSKPLRNRRMRMMRIISSSNRHSMPVYL